MIEILKILLKNNKFPQSTIFNGQDLNVPLFVIKYFFCSGVEKPCDNCLSCKKITRNVHPDVLIVEVEDNAKSIKINQIREVKSFCAMTTSGNYKVVFIKDAQLMTIEAQNSLLKILEEPGHNTYFILQVKNKYKLLPTILSRCVHFNLEPVEEVEAKDEFKLENLKKLSFYEVYEKLSELLKQEKEIEKFLKILIISNYPGDMEFLDMLLDIELLLKYNINREAIIGKISFYVKGGK